MVDWRHVRLEFTSETYDHIGKHRVKRFEVEEVLNHTFLPLKVRVNDEIRYVLLGESFGRMRLSHYMVFECRTELRGPIRHLSGKIC